MATKNRRPAPMDCTFFSCPCTARLWPPKSVSPQVTTEPSFSRPCTDSLSPPCAADPQVTTDPSSVRAAKARLVAWICCTFFNWPCTAPLSRHVWQHPRSERSRPRGWQRMRQRRLGSAAHSSASLRSRRLSRCHPR